MTFIKNIIASLRWRISGNGQLRFVSVEELWVATSFSSQAGVYFDPMYVFPTKDEAQAWGSQAGFFTVMRLDRFIEAQSDKLSELSHRHALQPQAD